jgi:hypothetical protein
MALLLSLALSAGCATIANDQRETIAVRSEPAGAVVSVECGAAPVYGGVTPANIIIERTADPCVFTIAKDGYAEQRVSLERQISRATKGNKVPGYVLGAMFGLIALFEDGMWVEEAWEVGNAVGEAPGNAIDRKTGAAYKHVPSSLFVRLDPLPEPR